MSLVSRGGHVGRRKQHIRWAGVTEGWLGVRRVVPWVLSSAHSIPTGSARWGVGGTSGMRTSASSTAVRCRASPPCPLPLKRAVRPPLERLVKGSRLRWQVGAAKPPRDSLTDRRWCGCRGQTSWGVRQHRAGAASLPLPAPWPATARPGLSAAHQAIARAGGDAGSGRAYTH